MRRFVLDCSVALAWCFEDEGTAYADAVLAQMTEAEAVVPPIWPFEVANVLLVGERRKRLTAADTIRFLTLLRAMPILVDQTAASHDTLDRILPLARDQAVSSYDAAYLELALREGCPLATLDDRLRRAGAKVGVTVLNP